MSAEFDLRFRSRWVAAFACVVLAGAVGCGGDSEESAEPSGEATSGGETGASSSGTSGADSGPTWDGDELKAPAGGSDGDKGDAAKEPVAAESPWGSALADQGTPLPERKAAKPAAQDSLRDGLDAARRGDVAEAKEAFEDALKEDPNSYEAVYNLGVLADRSGNEVRALEYYRRALRVQADYERAAEGIVTIHARRGQIGEALAFIEPLAKYWQRNLYLQAIYAETLVRAGKLDAAVEAARGALRRDERFVPAMIAIVKASLAQGRVELAASVLDQALAVSTNYAEAQYLKGQMLLKEDGRLRDAIERFSRAVQLQPDHAEARTALGVQLLAGANYPEALTHLQAAAQLAPHVVAVHLNLADAYRANKQWKKAKDAYDKALSMKSPLPEAHYNLALMYMTAGKDFPGLDLVKALEASIAEFTRYRSEASTKLAKDDPSGPYIEELTRQLEREKKRIEREKERARKEAERAQKAATEGGAK